MCNYCSLTSLPARSEIGEVWALSEDTLGLWGELLPLAHISLCLLWDGPAMGIKGQ